MARSGRGRKIRQAADLSLNEVAAASTPPGEAPPSHVTVLRWERGDRSPHGPAAVRWFDLMVRLEKAVKP